MRSDTAIREEGMRALRKSLGLVDAEKFLLLIRNESFDYTEWQRSLWQQQTVDELFELVGRESFPDQKR